MDRSSTTVAMEIWKTKSSQVSSTVVPEIELDPATF
jgi:hypothetical protein